MLLLIKIFNSYRR